MSRGRTVTLTEREVSALRDAMALWDAEHEGLPDDLTRTERETARALDRANAKLAEQSPQRRRRQR